MAQNILYSLCFDLIQDDFLCHVHMTLVKVSQDSMNFPCTLLFLIPSAWATPYQNYPPPLPHTHTHTHTQRQQVFHWWVPLSFTKTYSHSFTRSISNEDLGWCVRRQEIEKVYRRRFDTREWHGERNQRDQTERRPPIGSARDMSPKLW